jgi:hypothetical protein
MKSGISMGHHVSLTLPPDVEKIIQEQRKRHKHQTGYKPPRGIIISEAVRGFYGADGNTATPSSGGSTATVKRKKRR